MSWLRACEGAVCYSGQTWLVVAGGGSRESLWQGPISISIAVVEHSDKKQFRRERVDLVTSRS